MNKAQLANKIWESANRMRSKIEANEYKDYILGFIFYKYLSETEEKWLKENDFSEEDIKELREEDKEIVEVVQANIGYFISYDNLYSTWLNKGRDFDVSDVTDALSAFSRLIKKTHKKVFENIFHTLETGLSKLGESSGARTKAITGLLHLIKDIPMDGRQGYDVLGFIYEYLIEKFAANAGKKAGEFYTPHEVSLLMSEIVAHHLKDKKEIKIYDPTSGSGSLLINIGKSVSAYMNDSNKIKYYAQELKENTYNLTRMNLVMRGIKPDNIVTRNGDTLEEDWPYFEESDPSGTYEPLYVDAVVSNPPYSQKWDPDGKESDPRYARFGLAPRSKADYAFLLHDLYHIKPDGIMTIVLPHGVLFRGGEEGNIRKNLIENNHIDAVIGLPANIFFGTGIPTIIMVLKQSRENTDVLIVDASKGFMKEGKNNKLRSSDIKRIIDAVTKRENIESYCKTVSREEIRNNDYNLNIPRYVDSGENAESYDLYAMMYGGVPATEIDALSEYWKAFPMLKDALFKKSDIPYRKPAAGEIKDLVETHEDILTFKQKFSQAFSDFRKLLEAELMDKMETLTVHSTKALLSDAIFERLSGLSLIDAYEAYQLLDDEWGKISGDLEVIQTEGFEAVKKVVPNIVYKKKDGKEEEVVDGFVGHMIPFSLVQKTLLKDRAEKLHEKEERLLAIRSEFEELIDEMTEEEKEGDYLSETSFVAKEVTKKLKELSGEDNEEGRALKEKLLKADELLKEEKTLKAELKKEEAELLKSTKERIEGLSDEEARELLHEKWIGSLMEELQGLPDQVVKDFIKKIKALKEKYAETYADTCADIEKTERELVSMLDELVGNAFDMKAISELKAFLGGM